MSVSPHSFFVTGGTLRPDAACYVARKADCEIHEGLKAGDFCYVLTSRQMGKSSLMVRTVQRLRSDGQAVAVLDLTAIGQNLTVEQWYNGLLERLGRQLDLEDDLEEFWREHRGLSPVQRWFAALHEVALSDRSARRGLVIFVDEIDAVRSLPFSTDEFFAAIRECYNRRSSESGFSRLTFCLLGVATPSDLVRDTRTTPFNIGRRIELRDFTSKEAEALLGGLEVRYGAEFGRRILGRIQHWTNGQPYLTQLFCRTLVEREGVGSLRDVDRVCTELFLTEQAAEKNDNLVFVRERLLRSEVDRFELLQLYSRVLTGCRVDDDPSNPFVGVLRLAGVTREENGRLVVRSPIYRRVFDCAWVREHLPDAEVRRQRRAYWQGVVRAAMWASVALAVIATLWVNARFEAARADLSATRELEQRLEAVAAREVAVAAERQLREMLGQMELHQAEELFSGGQPAVGLAYLAHLLRSDPTNVVAVHRILYALSQRSFALPLALERGATFSPTPPAEYRLEVSETSGNEALVTRRSDGQVTARLRHEGLVRSARFSPDGLMIVTAGLDDTARVWEAATGKPLLPPLQHDGPVLDVSFSPEGLRIVTSAADRSMRVWDVTTGEQLTEPIIGHGGSFEAEFSEDGWKIVTQSRGRGRGRGGVWDIRPRNLLALPLGHDAPVRLLRISPDGNWLLTGAGGNHLRFWRVIDGSLQRELEMDRAVTALSMAPDSKSFLCGTAAGVVTRHSLPDIDVVETVFQAQGAITTAEYSEDGTRILISDSMGELRMIDLANRSEVFSKNLGREISRAGLNRLGDRVFAVATDRTVKIWNVADGALLYGNIGHFGPIVDASLNSVGNRLVTISRGAGPSPTRPSATLWELGTNVQETILEHNSLVSSAAFGPAGARIVTASWDRSVRIWDAVTGEVMGTQLLHDGPVTQASFFGDGWRLLTTTALHRGRIWNTTVSQPLSEVFQAPHTHHYLMDPSDRQGTMLASIAANQRRFAISTDFRTVRVWETFDPPLPAPHWLAELAELIGGQRVNERGSVVMIDRRGLGALLSRVEMQRNVVFYTDWLRWLLADRDERPIAPGAGVTFRDMIVRLLEDGSADRVREAARLAPTDPDVLESLARVYEAEAAPGYEIRAAHLRKAAEEYRFLNGKAEAR